MNHHRDDYDDMHGLSDDQVERFFRSGWVALTYAVAAVIIFGSLAFLASKAEGAAPTCPWDAACLSWAAPTQYVDGTALPASSIASYTVEAAATSAGPWTLVATVTAPTTAYQRRPVSGSQTYRVNAVLVSGATSAPSGSVTDVTTEPAPNAPIVTVAGTGYRMDLGNLNQIKIAAIGIVPIGIVCKSDNVNGLNVIDRAQLKLDPGKALPKQVLAKCSSQG